MKCYRCGVTHQCSRCGFDHKTSKHEEEYVKCDRCGGVTVFIHKQDWQKSECLECGFEELIKDKHIEAVNIFKNGGE